MNHAFLLRIRAKQLRHYFEVVSALEKRERECRDRRRSAASNLTYLILLWVKLVDRLIDSARNFETGGVTAREHSGVEKDRGQL
jgi:hypothetical protein